METFCFGVTRGEQPLVRASRASKVAGAFWFSFGTQKRTYPAVMLFTKGMKLDPRENALRGKHIFLSAYPAN